MALSESPYDKDVHPERMVELMKDGKTVSQVAADFGVSRTTLYKWRDKYPDMKLAFELGETHARAGYDLLIAQRSLEPSKDHDATLLIFQGKARFKDLRGLDKTIIEGGDADKPVQIAAQATVKTDWLAEIAQVQKK